MRKAQARLQADFLEVLRNMADHAQKAKETVLRCHRSCYGNNYGYWYCYCCGCYCCCYCYCRSDYVLSPYNMHIFCIVGLLLSSVRPPCFARLSSAVRHRDALSCYFHQAVGLNQPEDPNQPGSWKSEIQWMVRVSGKRRLRFR